MNKQKPGINIMRNTSKNLETPADKMAVTIYNTLNETYDANIFAFIPENIRVKVVYMVKDNHTLSRLIYNWSIDNQPTTEYLSGPSALTVHTKGDKKVYVFGEYHGRERDCQRYKYAEIQNYLRRLFKTSSTFIDFFLEIPSYEGEGWDKRTSGHIQYINEESSYLSKLRKSFFKCMQKSTRHSEDCELYRVHYVDVRFQNMLVTSNLGKLSEAMKSKVPLSTIYRNGDIMTALYELNIPANVEPYILESIFSIYKVNKELLKLDSETRKKIQYFISLKCKNISDDFNRKIYKLVGLQCCSSISNRLLYGDKLPAKELNLLYSMMRSFLVPMLSLAVDTYTLSRLNKKFSNTINQPSQAYNSVIYTGNNHSLLYRDFLEYDGYNLIEKAGNDSTDPEVRPRCLYMGSVKQPLFK